MDMYSPQYSWEQHIKRKTMVVDGTSGVKAGTTIHRC